MFVDLLEYVFAGCTDMVDKFFCMCMFLFVVELFVGIIGALIGGVRKK